MPMRPPTAVLLQLTLVEEHDPELPTPTTVIGLQSRPTRTFRSDRTTPRRPRSVVTAVLSAGVVVDSQHRSVLDEPEPEPQGAGVAAARVARQATAAKAPVNFIVLERLSSEGTDNRDRAAVKTDEDV